MKLSKEENSLIIEALYYTAQAAIKNANKGIDPNGNSRKSALMRHLIWKLKEAAQ